MTGQLVQFPLLDYDGLSGDYGYGYRIGDGYVLTAGHVFFDWNKDTSDPTIEDIRFGPSVQFLDYRSYRSAYLSQVLEEIADPAPNPLNRAIEGQLGGRDTIVIQRSGPLDSDDDGLVVFLDSGDLINLSATLDSSPASLERVTQLVLSPAVM